MKKFKEGHFHSEFKNVKIGSTAAKMSYQFGVEIHDNRLGGTPKVTQRDDIYHVKTYLPENAPTRFLDLQTLVDELEGAENRKDARTLRENIASLPKELSMEENVKIAEKYIRGFVEDGMVVALAIHEKPNNPHMHILLSTRPINPEGTEFARKKNRDWNKVGNVERWRKQLETVINEAYERNGLDIRVDHRSFLRRGKKQEAQKYLNRIDYESEKRGKRTVRGDQNRVIKARNAEIEKEIRRRDNEHQLEQQIQREIDRGCELER